MGRPTELTDDISDSITELLRAGHYAETAARASGISPRTYYRWMERGRREDERLANDRRARPRKREESFRQFWQAVERAKAEAEVKDLGVINQAAKDGNWQAAAWKLERMHPDRWGRRETTEHVGTIRIEDARERLKQKIERVASRQANARGDNGTRAR